MGDTLASLELADDEVLTVGSADLAGAFYHLQLPAILRPYSSLRRVRAGAVGVTDIDGKANAAHNYVYPQLKVCQMGWNRALFWCQMLHERLVEESGLQKERRLQDKRAAGPLDPARHLQDVDNLVIMGTRHEEVVEHPSRAVGRLRDAGLVVHEEEYGQPDVDGWYSILGWRLTQRVRVSPTPSRLWKARLALRGLLRRQRFRARDLERLLGHLVFISLLRREALACFDACYCLGARRRPRDGGGIVGTQIGRLYFVSTCHAKRSQGFRR